MLRLALTLILLMPISTAMADIIGKPRVVDGDTIHINQTKIRLHGIDAPEMKQTCRTSEGKEQLCGQLAKQALERLVRGAGRNLQGRHTGPLQAPHWEASPRDDQVCRRDAVSLAVEWWYDFPELGVIWESDWLIEEMRNGRRS